MARPHIKWDKGLGWPSFVGASFDRARASSRGKAGAFWDFCCARVMYCHLAADFAPSVPAELESALRLRSMRYLVTQRPWLGNFQLFIIF